MLLFSRSVMSDSLQPHGLQHVRLPCPSLSPRIGLNSCPLSQWCHPIISSSVTPFSCLQTFPASESFPMSDVFISGGQSIGALAFASVLPMDIQSWFSRGLTGLISLQSKGLSRVFSSTTIQKHQFFRAQPSLWSNSHIYSWVLEKPWSGMIPISWSNPSLSGQVLGSFSVPHCIPGNCSAPGSLRSL